MIVNVNFQLTPSCGREVHCRWFVVGGFSGLVGCVLLLLLLSGCGRRGPEVVPVDGVITFGGGPWPRPGVLYFVTDSPAPGMPSRPAAGNFDKNGHITVSTFTKGDGLIPGKYKINIECGELQPEVDSPTPKKSLLPKRYRSASTSGLTVTVEPNQKVVRLNLDVAKE